MNKSFVPFCVIFAQTVEKKFSSSFLFGIPKRKNYFVCLSLVLCQSLLWVSIQSRKPDRCPLVGISFWIFMIKNDNNNFCAPLGPRVDDDVDDKHRVSPGPDEPDHHRVSQASRGDSQMNRERKASLCVISSGSCLFNPSLGSLCDPKHSQRGEK
jgi:hypothetical protein